MKFICLLAPHLPVQVERRRDPSLDGQPLVVGGRPWDPGAVLDCCPEAAAAGVRPGMRLSRAEALCPSARFLPADGAGHGLPGPGGRGWADQRGVESGGLRGKPEGAPVDLRGGGGAGPAAGEAISILARRVINLEPKRGER
jgi:hypothetical protein